MVNGDEGARLPERQAAPVLSKSRDGVARFEPPRQEQRHRRRARGVRRHHAGRPLRERTVEGVLKGKALAPASWTRSCPARS